MAGVKKARIKQEAPVCPVPQTREETIEAIAEIGRRQRERERIQATMNDELALIRQKFEEEAAPHSDMIRRLSQGVGIWCEAHKAELTQQGKVKTASLASGKILWRMRPPKVVVRGAEMVLQALKLANLLRYVRTKEEINKEAILADPEGISAIKGIKIEQAEDFVIIPFETELEEVAT